jgi:serine/threonine protein kinase/Tol biopolymer transport system component
MMRGERLPHYHGDNHDMARTDAAYARGARIGRYEVESFLGAGGMGHVYVARDTSLGRRVALKVLPPNCPPDRIARFLREAQASSALAHPAIVSVHDAGEADGTHYLAMELIEGEPLSTWMHSRHSTERAVELMAQVAEGLARAHGAGIVHRDLKPENIMVSRDGYAKIVDFGIAKLKEKSATSDAATELKTATGSVVGTARYMSPEQIDGLQVDHRSDVFSFGTVLFELLTGEHPFGGTTSVETMHNITHRDPPLERVPAAYRRIVRRCLARDLNGRYDSMKDIAYELREALSEPAAVADTSSVRWWIPAIIALLLGIAGGFVWRRQPVAAPGAAPAATMIRLSNSGNVGAATISPDGKFVVHSIREGGGEALWLKQLSTGTATRISAPGADIVQKIIVSPDGAYVYYAATQGTNANVGNIFQMPILGGEPRKIAADTELTLAVAPDGKQVAFRRFNAATRVNALTLCDVETGAERVLLRRGAPGAIRNLAWSPDGATITVVSGVSGKRDHWLEDVSVDDGSVRRNWPDLPSREGVSSVAWLHDGSGILATVIDEEQPPQVWLMTRSGAPRKITSDLGGYYSATPTADGKSFVAMRGEGSPILSVLRVADDGTASVVASGLGYDSASGMLTSGPLAISFSLTRAVEWLDANHLVYAGAMAGRTTLMVVPITGGQPRALIRNMHATAPAMMPDGKRLAFISNSTGASEVWIAGADGSNARRLTSGAGAVVVSPSPDGRFIYYAATGRNQFIYRIPADGGEPKQITDVASGSSFVSPDGQSLLTLRRFVLPDGTAAFRTAVISAQDGRVIRDYPLLERPGAARWDPSGRSFTARNMRNGLVNLYKQDLAGGAPRPITNFTRPISIYSYAWSPDGKQIAMLHGEPRNDAVLITNFR